MIIKKTLLPILAISISLNTIAQDEIVNGNLKVTGNLDLTGNNKRIFLGGIGKSTFGISYNDQYPNYGIFYTEGTPDFVSISPNGNSKNGILNVFGNGNVGIGTNTPSNDQGWHGALDVAGAQHAKIMATSVNAKYRTGIFS